MVNSCVSILANLIINHYYNHLSCLLIFTEDPNNFDYRGEISVVKLKIFNDTTNFSLVFRNYGCQGVIIQSRNPAAIIVQFEKQLLLSLERFNSRRYLIVPPENGDTEKLENIFDLPQLEYVSDLLVIIPENWIKSSDLSILKNIDKWGKDATFLLKTHNSASSGNHYELVNKWFCNNQTFLYNKNLYVDKISNQYGRNLRISTVTYQPYSIPEKLFGSELSIAVYYSKKHNMTPVLVVKEDEYWGEIFENYTGVGLLGNLVEDRADVGFASMGSWDSTYQFLDFTKPTVRTGVTCLVPALKLAGGWLTPLQPYSKELWSAIATVFLLSTIITFVILHFYNNNSILRNSYESKKPHGVFEIICQSLVRVYKPLLVQSLTEIEISKGFTSKFLTFLMLIFSLFATITYSSGFATVMTLRRFGDAIDTVGDLARSQLQWCATGDAWIESIISSQEPEYVELVQKFVAHPEEVLQKFSETGKFGFAIERLPFENFAIGDYVGRDVIDNYNVMRDDIYFTLCVMMTRKSSVLLPSLDDFILTCFESGLISKWQHQAVSLSMDSYVQKSVKMDKRGRSVLKLKLIHVQGVFAALILGICVSFVVFLIEIAIYRAKKTNL